MEGIEMASNVRNSSGPSRAVRRVFSFPDTVNDYAARAVAAMVVAVSLAAIFTDYKWLLFVLVYGFAARVASGPKLSLMAQVAIRVVVPLLGSPYKPVPGPPKRFAQFIGLVFSTAALVLYFVLSLPLAANAVLGVLVLFASLEAVLGFCAGCYAFGILMRRGLIPETVCPQCVIGYEA
jgi:hypothetical protein